jgi:hypothetical protein
MWYFMAAMACGMTVGTPCPAEPQPRQSMGEVFNEWLLDRNTVPLGLADPEDGHQVQVQTTPRRSNHTL